MAAEAAPLISQVENEGDASDASETSSLMGREVERGMLARKVGVVDGPFSFPRYSSLQNLEYIPDVLFISRSWPSWAFLALQMSMPCVSTFRWQSLPWSTTQLLPQMLAS